MLSSSHVSPKKSDNDTTSTIATSHAVELNLLDAFYRETNPRYSMLRGTSPLFPRCLSGYQQKVTR